MKQLTRKSWIFMNNRSHAVRLSKKFQFNVPEVFTRIPAVFAIKKTSAPLLIASKLIEG